MSDNSLHFFINGVDVGKKIKTIPPVLYGVVDVFGQAEEVTITGMGVDYFSPSEVYDLVKDFRLEDHGTSCGHLRNHLKRAAKIAFPGISMT